MTPLDGHQADSPGTENSFPPPGLEPVESGPPKEQKKTKTRRTEKKKESDDRTSIIRFELGDVVGRYSKPPSFVDGKVLGDIVAPYSDKPAPLPRVWRKIKNSDKFEHVTPTSPWVALDRILKLSQHQLKTASEKALIAMWVNSDKPLPPLIGDPISPSRRAEPGEGDRLHPGTVAYQIVGATVNSTRHQDNDLVTVGSDVRAATARKIEQIFKINHAKGVVPKVGDVWPIPFRPTGWRLFPDSSIAFNLDGTWWHVKIRLPRQKGRRKKRSRFGYVFGTLKRLIAGEAYRGKPAATSPASENVWIPSTFALQRKEKDNAWQAIISYRLPPQASLDTPNAMFVHCGLWAFSIASDLQSMRERRRPEIIDGRGLISRKHRFREQRTLLQQSARKWAKHGKGHGYQARANKVDDTERRFVDEWLRRRAFRIVNIAKARKAKIFIAELKDIRNRAEKSDIPNRVRLAVHQAPWFRWRTFVEQAAIKAGIVTETYTPSYHTTRCPACLTIDKAAPSYGIRDRSFRCAATGCGFAGALESVVLRNAVIDISAAGRITLPSDWHSKQRQQDAASHAADVALSRAEEDAEFQSLSKSLGNTNALKNPPKHAPSGDKKTKRR